jgi:hypothetical protein
MSEITGLGLKTGNPNANAWDVFYLPKDVPETAFLHFIRNFTLKKRG